MANSTIPTVLKQRLLAAAFSLSAAAGGGFFLYQSDQPSAAVVLAHEIGSFYESSGKHIGTPYVDRLGKGQSWTVCNGVTGPAVDPKRSYSPADCQVLEMAILQRSERAARGMFLYWDDYNVWVQASIVDMLYNLGDASLVSSTLLRKANAGDLDGACAEMARWVFGTVNGQRSRLQGLVNRRATTQELCAQWGRDGHWSASLLEEGA